MALFDAHSKCARCHEEGLGTDDSVQNKDCEICNKLTVDQKKQFATPTYREQKEHQKKKSSHKSPKKTNKVRKSGTDFHQAQTTLRA